MTDAEQHLWHRLRRRQLEGHKFRRQFPIGPYIVDFVCLDARLIIELDGGQHTQRSNYDQTRDHWIASQKFRVLRFWNDEVLKETDGVLQHITEALSEPLSLTPSRKGRGD